MESSFAGIWSIDSELRTNFVNARMAEMLGYSPQEMLGRTLYDFLFPEDVSAEQNAIAGEEAESASNLNSGIAERTVLNFGHRSLRRPSSPAMESFWAQLPCISTSLIAGIRNRRSKKGRQNLRQAELLAGVGSWQGFQARTPLFAPKVFTGSQAANRTH